MQVGMNVMSLDDTTSPSFF